MSYSKTSFSYCISAILSLKSFSSITPNTLRFFTCANPSYLLLRKLCSKASVKPSTALYCLRVLIYGRVILNFISTVWPTLAWFSNIKLFNYSDMILGDSAIAEFLLSLFHRLYAFLRITSFSFVIMRVTWIDFLFLHRPKNFISSRGFVCFSSRFFIHTATTSSINNNQNTYLLVIASVLEL